MDWTISRSKDRSGKLYHVQARTADQFSSFACAVRPDAQLLRNKTPDGKLDVFTLVQNDPHVTFNVVGRIIYVQDWAGIPSHG